MINSSKMRRHSLAAPALVVLALAACSSHSGPAAQASGNTPGPCPDSAVRVSVSAQGVIRLEGHEIPATSFAVTLRSLSPPPTLVCYYSEAAAPAAPASVTTVLQAIMSMRLPVVVFQDAGFEHGAPVQ